MIPNEDMVPALTLESSNSEGPTDDHRPGNKFMTNLQVVASFFIFFNTWGVANSFGIFQTYYKSDLLSNESDSNISWIGSIQSFLLLFCGVFVGPIYDAGFGRHLVAVGSLMVVLGIMMISLSTVYWEVVLAQGITAGLGMGCLIMPALATLLEHFPSHVALATGVATSGGSIGGVIYPVLFRQLVPTIGFPWTTRVMAFFALGTLALSVAVIRTKPRSSKRRPIFDASIRTNTPYVLFTLSEFFGFMGLYIPFFYVQSYAIAVGVDQQLSFYLVVIMNAASTFGRIMPNLFAKKIGPINIAFLFTAVCVVLAYCWITIYSASGLLAFSVLYGFFSGTYVSIVSPAVASLLSNPDLKGTHLGMSLGFAALGLLVGNPVAGVLLGRVGWVGVQAWCGTTNAAAVIFMLAARLHVSGLQVKFIA